MGDYNEKTNILMEQDNIETKQVELVNEKEENNVKVDEKAYGINKPREIIIKAKISHD